MARVNCSACEEIRELSPELVVNGWSKEMCASMANDTGLSPSSGHDDCTDLELMNDCLIANLEAELDAYEVCDWKTFMHRFLRNLWTLLSAIKCAICGIWSNIHKLWTNVNNLWTNVNKLLCQVNYMYQGATFNLGEVYENKDKTHIVAGKGVSFLNVTNTGTSSDIGLTYVAGGLARLSGSILLYENDFTEKAPCYNFDNNGLGNNFSSDKKRKGNPEWVGSNQKPKGHSQLVYEIRVLKSEFPQIDRFFSGIALNAQGGGYHAEILRYPAGHYAPGQNGHVDTTNGDPANENSDRGHLVPSGWEYLQVRITWIESLHADGTQYTPNGLLGLRIKQSEIPC